MVNRTTDGRSHCGEESCRNQLYGEKNIIETLAHICGSCPRSELLLYSAHHKIRSIIVDLFRKRHLEIYEEIHCTAETDSVNQNRWAYIIVIDRLKNKCIELDPTIKWETKNTNQDDEINEEKRYTYLLFTNNPIYNINAI